MDFAILVKVVPAVEQIRYDPGRLTLIRSGVQSFLNPYDSRAVRIAVQLRRREERVTVLSMGPPQSEVQLRETFAFGADRVILLTDPALAGSDTLVTARVLHAALEAVGHDVILAGERSIDSETGQVGPEVAALLDVPVVTSVRSLTRSPDGDELEMVAETGSGWNRFRLVPPAVITVNERILRKASPPTDEERLRAAPMTVDTQSVRDLGFAPESVGLEGSRTIVRAVDNEEPERHPRIFGEGALSERIAGASAAVEELLSAPATRPARLPPISLSIPDDREVLVLVSGSDGATESATLGAVSELRRWGSHVWPSAVWVGRKPSDVDRDAVAKAGAVRGYWIPTDRPYIGSRTAARGLDHLLSFRPELAGFLLLANSFGREVGGQLAARRGLGLTGDAVGLSVNAAGVLVWRKPAFGGGLVASIRSRNRPSLATVRPGALISSEDPDARPLEVHEQPWVPSDHEPELMDSGREFDPRWGDLSTARIVVTVGLGLGGPENLPALEPTIRAWKAALGGTRRVVKHGWLPGGRQVGLTGVSVAADLAVLIGVGGAGNHLIGLRRTRVLVAINPDPAAPVFQRVDVGIVGGWAEVLPRLTDRWTVFARGRSAASG